MITTFGCRDYTMLSGLFLSIVRLMHVLFPGYTMMRFPNSEVKVSSDRVQEVLDGDGDDIGKLPELFLDVNVSSFPYDEKLTHYQTVGLGVFELSPKELCLGIEDKEYGREGLLEISKRLLRGKRLTDSHLWAEKELPEHNRHLDEHLFYIELLFEEECAIREWDEVLGAFMRHF